jgi:hypothetical protein
MIETQAKLYEATREWAQNADTADPLSKYRERFFIPRTESGDEIVYLTGNSLGLKPKSADEFVMQELRDWETLAARRRNKSRTSMPPSPRQALFQRRSLARCSAIAAPTSAFSAIAARSEAVLMELRPSRHSHSIPARRQSGTAALRSPRPTPAGPSWSIDKV